MIKKLRRRIIMINMLLMGVVIAGIFIAVNINTYSNSVHTLERGMTQLMEQKLREGREKDGFEPPDGKRVIKFDKQGGYDDMPMQISSYIMVTLDSNGKITETQESNSTMEEEDLLACIKYASDEYGNIDEYDLVYVRRDMMDKRVIVFTSNSVIKSSLHSSLFISALLFFGGMAVIFLISLFLSGLAVKPVKRAWEQQKQFVADASHELKTPLTVILANNNIMMSHKDATIEDERQWLESTEEEAGHMKKLIDNMLFLAKSDAGTARVQLSEVDFSEIVEGCALNFEPVAFEKGVMIDAQIEENVVLTGDATQLNQLAHILVDNAVKYADPDTAVTIRLRRRGDHAEFSVNNKGSVINSEELSRIFDRFYRAEKSRTTKGYGLGLSIAQRIVSDMNGKITVESSEASGTTFTVRI